MNKQLPFTIEKNEKFFDKLGDYIGDVFYDILPEKGFELRDEQIFMAFQLEQAYKNKSTIFAEAGVGTGKTIVYLLYALCYARYTGKPAIIACADETLIEQLVKKNGDIEKIEKALGLTIDARLAKSRDQYVCVKKLETEVTKGSNEKYDEVYEQIPSFVFQTSGSLQNFSHYGDRKEYSSLTNDEWEKITWDPLQQCSTCDLRHRCGQTLTRDYYRHATDLIICSQDFYMEHIWTKESRKRQGQLPLLPEASSLIFDEGHLLEYAAQKGLTYRFHSQTLTHVLTGYMQQNVREESLMLIETIIELHDEWFDMMVEEAIELEASQRAYIHRSQKMMSLVSRLNEAVEQLLDQLVFDSELFTIDEYHIKMIEEYVEFLSYGLTTFMKENEGIYWLEQNEGETTFVIMPRLVESILKEELFSKNQPIIFSSATLSQNKDFSFIAHNLGISSYDSFSVNSPFDYESKMSIHLRMEQEKQRKWEQIEEALRQKEGSSLVLFANKLEMESFKSTMKDKEFPFEILYEGDQEISVLVQQFQQENSTVLCSHHLWEGLDIPGQSLSQVLIASLPFPPKDPVFDAKRAQSKLPFQEVDLPYMLLRLRQGVGRLIRTESDSGNVLIWCSQEELELLSELKGVLPVEMILS
ncbi:ATP-dependent DNA helicase [Alkalihalobacillus pseudalcaliphilus]|uniref:ATP-dependent DNA helicase n=1 Tax=Alkalihalobacillus pseudalcaliphilus TaxID=79884 RepID=UPI00064DB8C3|nr:ATP-dependent DNA helicase [Alkalihalobacillus pseudalcaliphilus]KMK76166.1 ATP-dependent helicase [Alkalihalobacillus pseudalcaliphilus]